MILILFCTVYSLEQIKDFPSNFFLSLDEYEAIELNDYFSGNEIWFNISENTPEILLKQSGLIQQSSIQKTSLLEDASKTNLFINIQALGTLSSRFAIYASGKTLYLFDSNIRVSYKFCDVGQKIIWYSLFETGEDHGVILLTQSAFGILSRNHLKFISLIFENDAMMLGVPQDLNCLKCAFETFDTDFIYVSNGILFDEITITGYVGDQAYAALYTVTLGESSVVEDGVLRLGQFESVQIIFAVSLFNNHFIYVPNVRTLAQVMHIEGKNELLFQKSINLTEYNLIVTDMKLSLDSNYLLMGIEDGIMIISIDFTQVFISKFYMNVSNVQVTSSNQNIFLLLQNGTSNLLKVISRNFRFYEIGHIDLDIQDQSIGWGIYNSSLTGFSIILNSQKNLVIKYIQLSTPYMNITCINDASTYNLTAFENSTNKYIQVTFSLYQTNNYGAIEYLDQSKVQTAVFSSLKAEIDFRIYDYFCGYGIDIHNIELIDDKNLFNMTYKYSKCLAYNSMQIDSNLSWSKGIISSNEFTFIYGGSLIYRLHDKNLTFIQNFEFTINKILNCVSHYVFDITIGNQNFLVYSDSAISPDLDSRFQYESFSSIQCSDRYVTGLNESGLFIYKLGKRYSRLLYIINKTVDNYHISFNSYYLSPESFICAIVNETVIMMFNVLGGGYYPINFPSIQFSVRQKPIQVHCSGIYLYHVVFIDNTISVYNQYAKLIRSFFFQPRAEVFFVNDYIITTSHFLLQVFNATGSTCGVLLGEVFITTYLGVSYTYEDNLVFNVLTESFEFISVSINSDHSKALITFNYANKENISDVLYEVNLNISLGNFMFNTSELIPFNVFTNGETIFKNISNINDLKSSLADLDCSKSRISLDNLFVGQDLTLILEENSHLLKIRQKLSDKQFLIQLNETFTAFLPVSYTDIFIFANRSLIMVFDIASKYTSAYLIVEDYKDVKCFSFVLVYTLDYLIFAAGCEIIDNRFGNQIISYRLYFFKYHLKDLEILLQVDLPYKPSIMSSAGTVNGYFVIMMSDTIDNYMSSSFACNHFQIVAGLVEDSKLEILLTKYLNPISLGINYYYIIDFTSCFDPMFKNFYLYLLDWHYGIRIIKISDISPSLQYEVRSYSLAKAVALTKCGTELYVSYDNTTVLKFFLLNWFTIEYYSQIYLYKTNYHAVPASIECSSNEFSRFLIMLISNESNHVLLHIINNRAKEISSIVADEFVYNDLEGVYAFFDKADNVAIITPEDFYFYTINDYYLEVTPPDKCEDEIKKSLQIRAVNENNVEAFCLLELKIKENYDDGSVSADSISYWIWLIIVGFIFAFVLIGIKFSKKYSRRQKQKKPEDVDLFNYEFSEAIN